MQVNEVLMLYAKLGAYGGSSTRSELAAGIIAMAAEGPIYIGSDSKCFIDNANKLLHEIKMQTDHTNNWKLKNDGDLWNHLHFFSQQRA